MAPMDDETSTTGLSQQAPCGRVDGIARLYAIADADTFGEDQLPTVVATWADRGLECIQLRMKGATERRMLDVGRQCLERLEGRSVAFWVNDSIRVARDLEATGVHLGQDDEPPSVARLSLADDQLIGRSTHGMAQALDADRDVDVDVVAVGPIFKTISKRRPDPEVGLQELRSICRRLTKPVIAIGGISPKNCPLVISAGAASVAVIGALKESIRPTAEGARAGAVDRLEVLLRLLA